MRHRQFHIGQPVVFCVTKRKSRPGKKGKDIRPEPAGEGYQYRVDKFWVVSQVLEKRLVLLTPRGRTRLVDPDDWNLRAARWWERVYYRNRFPRLDSLPAVSQP